MTLKRKINKFYKHLQKFRQWKPNQINNCNKLFKCKKK